MTKIHLALLFSLILLGCAHHSQAPVTAIDMIPEDPFILVKINNLQGFGSDLKNNDFLNQWKETNSYQQLAAKLEPLQYLQSNGQATLGFYKSHSGQIEYFLSAPFNPDMLKVDNQPNFSKETLQLKGREVERYNANNLTFFARRQEGHLLVSSSDSLLLLGAESMGGPKDGLFRTLYETASQERNATIFIKGLQAPLALSSLFQTDALENIQTLGHWAALDFGSQQDYISLSGIALPNDSISSYAHLYRDADALPLLTPGFAPGSATAMAAYGIGDYQKFAARRKEYQPGASAADSLFHTVEEVGLIHDPDGILAVLHTYGAEPLEQYLRGRASGSINYKEHEIYRLNAERILADNFHPLIPEFYPNFYTLLGNSLVFASEEAVLKKQLDHYQLGSTFNQGALFNSVRDLLADEASALLVAGEKGLKDLLEGNLGESLSADLKKTDLSDHSFALQLVGEESFYHLTLLAQKIGARDDLHPTSPWYTVALDAPIATEPQFVTNHRTRKEEIVVQDEDNNLYLISTEGKVLWKKPLDGQVQGKIVQVDLYKNGRLQLAFTTGNQFLILDRNGKEVAPFNLRYPGGNLNPLAVFDYDSNKNYRFVVTQGNQVLMYNAQGKVVTGFNYTKSDSPILPSPQHIRFGNKDYLVFRLESGEMKILSRTGHTRIAVSEKIDFSGNEVYPYRNQFALTDKAGTLYLIDEKGKITKTEYGLNQDHGMEATSKSMAFMNENILNIKGNEVTLDFGVYTPPRIFYIYDKIYVSVTDLQSNRAFLFDSQAQPIAGFPVSAASAVELGDMVNDGRLEMAAKLDGNTLVVYRLR